MVDNNQIAMNAAVEISYFEKEKAGKALIERCKKMTSEKPVLIGDYRGFSMELSFGQLSKAVLCVA